jgi:hypothetical protein
MNALEEFKGEKLTPGEVNTAQKAFDNPDDSYETNEDGNLIQIFEDEF